MVEKIHAACDARCERACVVQARTDAFATHRLQEVLRRLTLYAEAGAALLLCRRVGIGTRYCHGGAVRCQTALREYGVWDPHVRDDPLIAPARLQELSVAAVIYPRLLTACAIPRRLCRAAGA